MTLDVLTIGEALIRLSVPPGVRLETAPHLDVAVAELNVAATLARLGHRVAWASVLPSGPFARRVLDEVRAAGIDPTGIRMVDGARMGTYFVELHAPPRAVSVIYDRAGSAITALSPEDVPAALVDSARIVHLTGITPALSPSCLATARHIMERAQGEGRFVSFDLNYRARLWAPEQAGVTLAGLMPGVDLLLATHKDARILFDAHEDPRVVAKDLAERFSVPRVVITAGERGAWWREREEHGHVPALPVAIVDRLGAGDAFAAGVLDGLLHGDLREGVRTGTALAAIALTTRGDQTITTREEVEAVLADEGRRVDR